MKRTSLICLALAVMFSLAACNDDFGLNFITTTSNGDPNSCLLNLTYTMKAKKIIFTVKQYIPDPINRSCTYQDITTAPLFWVATAPFTPVNLNLVASASDPNTLTGEWTYSDMINALGKSCLDTGFYANPPNQIYTCRFRWSSLYIYVDFLMVPPLNNSFDITATRVLFPELVNALQSSKYGYDDWVPNPAFPQRIIGRLMDGCGANNWDNVINSLSTHVTITGTEYNSAPYFDLHTYFDSATTYNSIVRNAQGQFITKQFQFNPFDHPSAGGCTDMGITYGQILPDLNFCKDGCSVTFILIRDVQQYALSTNGIKSSATLLRV